MYWEWTTDSLRIPFRSRLVFSFQTTLEQNFLSTDEIFTFRNNVTLQFDSAILKYLHLAEEYTYSNTARNLLRVPYCPWIKSVSSRCLWLRHPDVWLRSALQHVHQYSIRLPKSGYHWTNMKASHIYSQNVQDWSV